MRVRELTLTALNAAMCCVISPIAIPVGAIPVSLSLLAVLLAAAVPGSLRGIAAVGIYMAIGAVGLPVFAGFSGGIGHLTGPTGGFILGYLPCAFAVGLMTRGPETPPWRFPVGMILGTLSCYICGLGWFMLVTKNSLGQALTVCVLPFVLFDAVKIAVASVLAPRLRKIIMK